MRLIDRVRGTLQGCKPALLLGLLLATGGSLGLSRPAAADTGTRSSAFTYDATTGLLATEVIEPGTTALKLTTTYTRDAFGNSLTAVVSGSGISSRTTTTGYDAKGQFPTSVTNALNQVVTATYDMRFGTPATTTDANGQTNSTTYDAFGRMTGETAPDGTFVVYRNLYCAGVADGTVECPTHGAYRTSGQYRSADDTGKTAPTRYAYYDRLGREIQTAVEDKSGVLVYVDTQYDSKGRVAKKSQPYRSGETIYWTQYSYDALGRVVTLIEPGGEDAIYGYNGLVTTETNFLGQIKTTTRNAQGRIVSVKDPANKITSYAYDAFGNLISTTDSAGNISTSSYDIRGSKIAADDPDMGAWSYTYDVLGQIKTQTDAKGQVTTLTYDKLGRMTQRVEPGLTSNWTYDTAANGIGRLASEATTNYSKSYSYDGLGRLSQTTTTEFGHAATVSLGYNSNTGFLNLVTYPSGFAVEYVYTRGYLIQVKDPLGPDIYWKADSVAADGQITQATLGNGLVVKWGYAPDRRYLTSIRAGSGNGVANFTYSYDALGNLLTRGDANSSLVETFGYDNRNRLTSYQVNSQTAKTVTYNDLGNILTKSDVGTYSYPATGADRPHAVSAITPAGSGTVNTSFAYDANGNLTSGKGRSVTWTSFDMVASITMGSSSVSFNYDVDHNRIRQVATSGTTLYFWEPALGLPVEKELGLAGAATWKEYIVAGGRTIAQHRTTVDGSGTVTGTQLRYFVGDHLGSIAVVTDNAGAVVERLSYDAWGQRRNPDGSDPSAPITSEVSRGFTGHEMLDAVGLVHMNGRIYDPLIGRFMSADPTVADASDGQGLNRYSYVNNNPLSFTDPSGYFLSKLFKGIGKLIKGIAQGIADLLTHPRQLFALAAGVALFYALGPGGILALNSQFAAAGIAGGVAGAISTGSPLGALMGAVTAVAFTGIGDLQNIGPYGAFKRAGLKGLVGGTTGFIEGEKFQSGFLSAGFAGLAGEYASLGEKNYAANFAVQGTVGGIAAELGGGKFKSGFATGSL